MRRTAPAATTAAITLTALACTPAIGQIVDAEFDAQWGLAAVGAQYALERGLTGAGIPVGIVDGPMQLSHPEFTGRIYSYQFNPDNDPPDSHGTHVGGVVSAGRNGFGMEGVAPLSLISSINRAVGDTRAEWYSNLAVGYQGALNANIRIFNNSWGPPDQPITKFTRETAAQFLGADLMNAFFQAAQKSSVLIFATGNQTAANPGIPSGLPYLYPELKANWIDVTAVDRTLKRASYADACGVAAQWCIAAPGSQIYSTIPPSTYDKDDGTSFAAPHVTGAVVLAKQMFPNASGAQLASIVLHTATDLGDPGVDPIYGWGLLSIENLVNSIDPGDDPEDGDDNGALFVNVSYARFAAVDTLITTFWNRSAQRIMAGGRTPATTVAQIMSASTDIPPMALGGPPLLDDANSAVMLTNDRGTAAWAQALGAYARLDGSPRSSASLGGVIGGYDLIDSETVTAGIAIAFTDTNLDVRGNGDDGSATGWHGFAYATWLEDNWFIDGIFGGNRFDNKYKRTAIGGANNTVLGNAGIAGSSSNDTNGFAARLTGGHRYELGLYTLTPYAHRQKALRGLTSTSRPPSISAMAGWEEILLYLLVSNCSAANSMPMPLTSGATSSG